MVRNTVKVKKMSVASKEEADALHNMFEQMTGAQNADIDVIIPKYLKLKKRIARYHKLFNILVNFNDFGELLGDNRFWLDEIREFIENLIKTTDTQPGTIYDEGDPRQLIALKKYSEEEFNKIYKGLKDNEFIKRVVITGSNLSQFKRHIENSANLDDTFIMKEPGFVLEPFEFSQFDLKWIWCSDEMTHQAKKYILSILHHAYIIGIEVYEILTSPDIDISKFSNILVDSIAKLRKQIPRCDKAFDIIENSVKMLENNFSNYYKSSVEAENPSVIIESFIIDISESQSASPVVTAQFKRIVAYLKEKSAGNKDPKVKKLFGMLNSQFSAMDKELSVKRDPNEKEE